MDTKITALLEATEIQQIRSYLNQRLIQLDRQAVPSSELQSHNLEYGQLLTIDQKLVDALAEMGIEV